MATNLPAPRTAFHKRLQSLTESLDAESNKLDSSLASLNGTLDLRLTQIKQAVESRPPPGDPLDYVLKVKIEAVLGPTKWTCWNVRPDQSVLDAAYLMSQRGVTAVFVKENERIAGLLTRGQALAALESGKTNDPVTAIMVKHGDFIGLRLSDTVKTALDLFEVHRVKRLMVRDAKDKFVAVLTSGYLLRWLGLKLKELHSASSP